MPRILPTGFDPSLYSRLGSTPLTSPTTGQVPLGTASGFLRNVKTGELMDQGDFTRGEGFMGGERVSDERWQQMLDAAGPAAAGQLRSNSPQTPLPLPRGFTPPDPIGDMERWRQSLKDWKANGMVGPRPMMPGSSPPPLQPGSGGVTEEVWTNGELTGRYHHNSGAVNPDDLGYNPGPPLGGGRRLPNPDDLGYQGRGGGLSPSPGKSSPPPNPDDLGYQGRGGGLPPSPGKLSPGVSLGDPGMRNALRRAVLGQFLQGGMRGMSPRTNLLLRLLRGWR